MNKEIEKVLEIINRALKYRSYNNNTYAEFNIYDITTIKQYIIKQEEEIENKRKAFEHTQYISQEHLDKLDKIQKIINHADEVGLDLVYYKDIKKVLEEK